MNCTICGAATADATGVCETCRKSNAVRDSARVDPNAVTASSFEHGPVESVSFAPGAAFADRYTIVEEVGAGGMGQVYKAMDRTLGKTVALKLIRQRAAQKTTTVARFERELALAQAVTHPNVCRLHDMGESGGMRYISMEYVAGQTLEDLILSVGMLSPRQTVAIARQLCSGLEAIHTQGIVHRDIKPSNVMLDRAGHAILMDFGLAFHPGEERLTGAGAVLGTFGYLSPEQARGREIDARSDVFSMGLLLFEMLTGKRPPADGQHLPMGLRGKDEPCPAPSSLTGEVPPALDAIVLRCLEHDPHSRFGSAADLEQALGNAAAALPPLTGAITTAATAASPRSRRRPVLLALAAAGIAVAGYLAASMLASWLWPPPPVTVALLPLAYTGPADAAHLKEMLPLLLSEGLRGNRRLIVTPFAISRVYLPEEESADVARQLNVAWLVRGAIQVEAGVFSAQVRLVDRDGVVGWQETLRGRVAAPFAEGDRIAAGLTRGLGAATSGLLAKAAGRDPRALAEYLSGRAQLEGWDVGRNYERAETAFRAALKADANFAESHAGLAQALWRRYRETGAAQLVEQALREAQRAVDLSPALPEAYLALGVVQLGKGQSAEAAMSFSRAQELAPADDAVCRGIADAYALLDRRQEAERLYRRALELRPGYWHNHNALGTHLWRAGNLDAAKEVFNGVIRLRPNSYVGYSNLGAVHIMKGELREAEPLLERALALNPSVAVRANLAFVYYGTGQYEKSVEQSRAAIEAGSKRQTTFTNLGDALRQLGRREESRAAYRRAIEIATANLAVNERDAEARGGMAMALAGVDRCREAAEASSRAIAQAPENPTLRYYAAVMSAMCGRPEDAVPNLVVALKANHVADIPTNPDLKPLLANAEVAALLAARR